MKIRHVGKIDVFAISLDDEEATEIMQDLQTLEELSGGTKLLWNALSERRKLIDPEPKIDKSICYYKEGNLYCLKSKRSAVHSGRSAHPFIEWSERSNG